ncbi:MAG: transglutaminase-like domain-containing protein [Promethearchaeota archaeon]
MAQIGKEFEETLKPTFYMDWEHPSVRKKAQELIDGIPKDDNIGKAIKLFYFVRDEVRYSVSDSHNAIHKETLKSSLTLERRYGFCIPKAILLASLARAVGIPSKLHFFDIINHMISENLIKLRGTPLLFHGFTELYLNNKWLEANCAFNKELCLRKKYSVVDFDGINNALFASTNKEGTKFVDYINDRGVYNDVPHQKIVQIWTERHNVR